MKSDFDGVMMSRRTLLGAASLLASMPTLIGTSTPAQAGSLGSHSRYPLDIIAGAGAAYSYRKLRSAYSGNAVKARNGLSNTTKDIGFAGQDFDAASFNTFANGQNCFADTWYDQSGNTNDQQQHTAGQQPLITSLSSPTNYGGFTHSGNGTFMTTAASAPSIESLWANGGFVAFVYDVTGGTTGAMVGKGSAAGWLIFSYLNGTTYQLLLYLHAAITSGWTWTSNAVSANARHVVTVAWNASSVSTPATITLDGVVCGYNSTQTPVGAFSDSTVSMETFNDTVISANNTALGGGLFEVMMWKSIPSAAAQANLIKNMRTYYGV
jgi:Alpha-L-arabinofuranosidase B, catalytic